MNSASAGVFSLVALHTRRPETINRLAQGRVSVSVLVLLLLCVQTGSKTDPLHQHLVELVLGGRGVAVVIRPRSLPRHHLSQTVVGDP